MNRKRGNILFAAALIAVAVFFIWNLHAALAADRLQSAAAKEGIMKHETFVKAIFANTEIILTSPIEGKIIPLRGEGQRFSKGEIVAVMSPAGVDISRSVREVAVSAPFSGLFFTRWDDLEQVLTPDNLMNMELSGLLEQVEQIAAETAGFQEEKTGSRGLVAKKYAPIGKMVDNLSPTWMFMYTDGPPNITEKAAVKFIIDGEEYSGTVMKVSCQPAGAVIRLSRFVAGTTEKRSNEIIWCYKPPSKGLLVPLSSICSDGEEKIVYVQDGGIIRGRNVQLIDADGSFACVKGLPEGSRVVVNPQQGMGGSNLSD
jgi:hypothetical protein